MIEFFLLQPLFRLRHAAWRRRALLLSAFAICVVPFGSLAQRAEIAPPKGPVILTVDGDIELRNSEDGLDFDFDMLAELPVTQIVTHTPWTDGLVTFDGVLLSDFLTYCGITSGMLDATALNDYSVVVPVSDAVAEGPILAYRRDGEVMSVRDKGPIWLIYPFDDNPDYRTEPIQARSIWQLRTLSVRSE